MFLIVAQDINIFVSSVQYMSISVAMIKVWVGMGGKCCTPKRLWYSRLRLRLNICVLRDLLRNPIFWTRCLSGRLTR